MIDPPTHQTEPDPEFADRLERLLLQRLTAPSSSRGARDIVAPNQPADPDARPLSVARPPARSPWRVVAAAAVVALIVATGLTVTRNRDRGEKVVTSPGPTATTLLDTTELFPDLAPDATMALPGGPASAGHDTGIWTGTELIVWGEPSAPDASPPPDGAAYAPSTGTWRTIAPAPIGSGSPVAWTGTEMIVWGGPTGESAAYDPEADTWRRLPPAPIPTRDAIAVWTGHEAIALGSSDDPMRAAAYDPVTDEWRALAGADGYLASGAVWTGTSLLTILDVNGPDENGQRDSSGLHLARYDLRADTWHIDADARYVTLVGVPDADGVHTTVIAMPAAPDEPVNLLDATGNPIGSLPAHPSDVGGSTTVASGIWIGEETVFWIRPADDWLFPSLEAWALNPATETWRPLPDDVSSLVNDGATPVAVGDVLLLWDGARGIAYRTRS